MTERTAATNSPFLHRPSSLIDCDVHVTWRSVDELKPYLPREWHNRLGSGRGAPRIQPAFYLPGRGYHPDAAAPAPGAPPGSDPDTLRRDWLDRHQIDYAVLTSYDAPVVSTWGDMEYPAAIARAYNDWLLERWLSRDPRFLGSIVVATQDPAAAAAEVDRAGAHPQVVQVMLSAGARQGYGQRTFHPIYEAAARHGLHVALHTGTEGLGTSNPPTSAGWPSSGIEWRATQPHNLSAHLVSLVTEGVFVRFPTLRVVLLADGAAQRVPQAARAVRYTAHRAARRPGALMDHAALDGWRPRAALQQQLPALGYGAAWRRVRLPRCA